jgi:hypothetical protein
MLSLRIIEEDRRRRRDLYDRSDLQDRGRDSVVAGSEMLHGGRRL